uniref:Uncharacterized protein n=1 Tax=Panagrolaimus sp. JU765 TaxID=591449 RepID=A0AC34QYK4_9BILA
MDISDVTRVFADTGSWILLFGTLLSLGLMICGKEGGGRRIRSRTAYPPKSPVPNHHMVIPEDQRIVSARRFGKTRGKALKKKAKSWDESSARTRTSTRSKKQKKNRAKKEDTQLRKKDNHETDKIVDNDVQKKPKKKENVQVDLRAASAENVNVPGLVRIDDIDLQEPVGRPRVAQPPPAIQQRNAIQDAAANAVPEVKKAGKDKDAEKEDNTQLLTDSYKSLKDALARLKATTPIQFEKFDPKKPEWSPTKPLIEEATQAASSYADAETAPEKPRRKKKKTAELGKESNGDGGGGEKTRNEKKPKKKKKRTRTEPSKEEKQENWWTAQSKDAAQTAEEMSRDQPSGYKRNKKPRKKVDKVSDVKTDKSKRKKKKKAHSSEM